MTLTASIVCALAVLAATVSCSADLDRCNTCKQIVDYAISLQWDDAKGIFSTICNTVSPDADEEWCRQLLGKMSPEDACSAIGACISDSVNKDSPYVFSSEIEMPGTSNDWTCALCQSSLKVAQHYLTCPAHRKEILDVLKLVCQYIPFFGSSCSRLIDTYGPMVLSYAAQFLNPSLCKLFHICPKEVVMVENECRSCQLSMGIVHDTLRDPALGTRIEQLTTELCNQSTGFNWTCRSFGRDMSTTFLPLLQAIGQSGFFKNACQKTNICIDDE